MVVRKRGISQEVGRGEGRGATGVLLYWEVGVFLGRGDALATLARCEWCSERHVPDHISIAMERHVTSSCLISFRSACASAG